MEPMIYSLNAKAIGAAFRRLTDKVGQSTRFSLTLGVVGLLGILYFGAHLHGTASLAPVVAEAQTISLPETSFTNYAMSKSEPVRLRIPAIEVNAPFIQLGLMDDGALETPKDGAHVGWYKYSPTPGERGPAVVAAHVDTYKDGIAVFWYLYKLQPNDSIMVDRADGSTATFKVDSVAQYPQDEFPTDKVYGDVDYAGIRLITCGGVFSTDTRHYNMNTVVFGSLVQ